MPDLVLIFDVDQETAARRAGIVSATRTRDASGSLFADRMEDKGREFQRKVRESYLNQAERDPSRHAVLDARRGPEEVWEAMLGALGERFG
jgi:dTMP kinase